MLSEGKSGPAKAGDIDMVAAWVCTQTRIRRGTDADALFNEMSKRGLVAIDGEKLKYVDSKLKESPSNK
eukprot:3178216-Amphidinium_carterae.1